MKPVIVLPASVKISAVAGAVAPASNTLSILSLSFFLKKENTVRVRTLYSLANLGGVYKSYTSFTIFGIIWLAYYLLSSFLLYTQILIFVNLFRLIKEIRYCQKLEIVLFYVRERRKYRKIQYAMVTFYNYCLLFYGIEYGITKNIPQMVGNFSDKDYIPKEMNYWTIEEYRQFNGVVNELIYKILFQFLYFTGCRLGEALALTFDDFNSDTKYISITKTLSKESINGKRIINTPKTKKSIRKILIDDKLVNDIKELREYYSTYYPDFNNNYYIFGGNKPLSPTTIERKKNNWCIESGVKQIRIHDFRHSHATILVNSDLPIKAISERLGHGDVAFTINTYVHTNSEDEKRVIRTLSSLHSLV